MVIEASGNVSALREALDYLRVGKLLVVGQSTNPLEVRVSPDIVFKEAEIYGFFGRKIRIPGKNRKTARRGKNESKPGHNSPFSLRRL